MGDRAGKYKLGARAGKYKLGDRTGKYKLGARPSKHKLGARARKYKLWARAGHRGQDRGPSKESVAGKYKSPFQMPSTDPYFIFSRTFWMRFFGPISSLKDTMKTYFC